MCSRRSLRDASQRPIECEKSVSLCNISNISEKEVSSALKELSSVSTDESATVKGNLEICFVIVENSEMIRSLVSIVGREPVDDDGRTTSMMFSDRKRFLR
jgi:hypothetical protein